MASYRKTKSGKYEFFVELGKDPATGKRKRESKTFDRVKDGQNWVAEIKTKLKKGIVINTKNITFAEFCAKFIAEYAQPNLSPTTLDGYLSIINNHLIPAYGAAQLKDIKAIHIDTYINEKRKRGQINASGGLSERTLLHHFRLISKIFYQAQNWDVIEVNPIIKATSPTPKNKEAKFYTREQLQELLRAGNENDKWIYRFILIDANTGLRISEMLGLQWKYINLDKRLLSVREVLVKKNGKGAIFKELPKSDSSRRTIELPEILIPVFEEIYAEQEKSKKLLDSYYTERELVFCKDDGTKYYPTTVNRKFNKIKLKAGIEDRKLNIHSLRHTHATMLMELGWPDRARQKRLGHYSSEFTNNTYTHVSVNFENALVKKLDEEMTILIE